MSRKIPTTGSRSPRRRRSSRILHSISRFLFPGQPVEKGFVTARDGRLSFEKGGRARFHGVSLIAPTAFLEPDEADQLADRLARSGINLVRLGDLDTPIGPDRSLFDDTRDDTKAFDPRALSKLDHLIAALKTRGIHVALELQSSRRFRDQDGVAMPGLLPAGGGPAALFDPTITKLSLQSARSLLSRKNPETGLALKDDPALAWVTLLGEVSLFDLIDHPDDALPGEYAQSSERSVRKSPTRMERAGGSGRQWRPLISGRWPSSAQGKLRVPIAGCSHWRREPEFAAAQAAQPLDLIDDRLYWAPPTFVAPEMKSQLWSQDGALNAGAQRKRHPGWPTRSASGAPRRWEPGPYRTRRPTCCWPPRRPCMKTGTPWSGGASFFYPALWGEGPAGTVGVEDIFQIRRGRQRQPARLCPLAARGFDLAARTGPEPGKTPNERDSQRGEA